MHFFAGVVSQLFLIIGSVARWKFQKSSHLKKSAHLQYGYQMQGIFKQNAKMKFIFTIDDSLFHFYS